MTQKAKKMLKSRLVRPDQPFWFERAHGGVAGSLVGLGFITRAKEFYHITSAGLKWIGWPNH